MKTDGHAKCEDEVAAFFNTWLENVRRKDADAVIASYGSDVVAFDLLPPMQYRGSEALKKRLSDWLASFPDAIEFEAEDVHIVASQDVAFCHSLNHVKGTTMTRLAIDMWWRATLCLRKIGGRWLVTHAHSSEPFDMQSGKALMDLKP